MFRLLTLAALALGLWMTFGPLRPPPVGGPATQVSLSELALDPAAWDGRRVAVTGQVIDRALVLGIGGVLIGDAAGNRLLVAGLSGPVVPGRETQVTGDYRLLLAVGEVQVPVVLTGADRGG